MSIEITNIRKTVDTLCGGCTYDNKVSDRDVTGISYDSRKTVPGDLFVCMVGFFTDGHDYIDKAIENGAVAILAQDPSKAAIKADEYKDILFLCTKDNRRSLAILSRELFGHPDERISLIGITGTKGKTTTTYMIKSILEQAGNSVGLIGTIECIIGNEHRESHNTTPESYEIFKMLKEMEDAGENICVMEVSSQAMKLDRCYGLIFDVAAVTNITEDHIGPNEHTSFEEYLECKKMVLKQAKKVCLNIGDPTIKEQFSHEKELTYSLNNSADIICDEKSIRMDLSSKGFHTYFTINNQEKSLDVEIHLPGAFNVGNAVCAYAVTSFFGVTHEDVKSGLKSVHVPGRAEPINTPKGAVFLVDYAHNAESMRAFLTALSHYPHNRIITIFGCGGNRAVERRYGMGEVSGELSDISIIANDNPRFEPPENIISMIAEGVERTGGKYVIRMDRAAAIEYAYDIAKKGDIICLLGKGHEGYREQNGVIYDENDSVMVYEMLKRKQ